MDPNRFQWMQMKFKEPHWIPVDPNGSHWIQMDPNGSQWITKEHNGPQCILITAIPWCDRQYSIPLDQRQRRAYNSSLHWDEFTQIPAVAQW